MLYTPLQEFNYGAMAEVELIIYNTELLEVYLKLICMCYDRTVVVNITKVPQIKSLKFHPNYLFTSQPQMFCFH